MSFLGLNPFLIPRFNIDYHFSDFVSSLIHLGSEPNTAVLNELFSSESISFTNSGRTSLYVILKALDLPAGSNIGIPLYNCVSDFDAIIHAGHHPVFIDIDPDNYTMDPNDLSKKVHSLAAVVVVHTFGRLADMDKLMEIAGDKPVIEDCAHALLSKYKGKLAGTIGTAGFFSFRTGKYISAGEGGMIISKDTNLVSMIDQEIDLLPSVSIVGEIKHALVTFLRSTLYHRPWFGLISLPLGKKIEKRVDVMNKYSFKLTKIRHTDLHVILRKMNEFEQKVAINRKKSMTLMESLRGLDIKLPIENTATHCNYFLFPLQFNSESERDVASNIFFSKGFDSAKLFCQTPDIAAVNYGYKGDCLNTKYVSERILVIPQSRLNIKNIHKIKRVLENVSN
ncbi:hypothetical protein HNV12_07915 [Methanococcoides sp. SA1]|nr:hypothetical protein [Methanococcoides sp. SA1]